MKLSSHEKPEHQQMPKSDICLHFSDTALKVAIIVSLFCQRRKYCAVIIENPGCSGRMVQQIIRI